MSEEAPPNPIPTPDTFNTNYFFNKTGELDYLTASKYFLKLSGGTVGYINSSLYMLNGGVLDFDAISGITNGTALANKALIVDNNKDITAINHLSASLLTGTLQSPSQPNVTSLGTLTSLSLNGSISLTGNNTVCNSTLIFTNGGQPTTSNGLGVRFSPLVSLGVIRCYNYITNKNNALTINDNGIYIEGGGTVVPNIGVGTDSLTSGCRMTVNGDTCIQGSLAFSGSYLNHGYYLSVSAGTVSASKALIVNANKDIGVVRRMDLQNVVIKGASVNTADYANVSRLLCCIDDSMGNNSSRYITLGKKYTNKNSAEFAYFHGSDDNDDNHFSLGGYGFSEVLNVFANSTVSIGHTGRSSARVYLASGVGNSTYTGSGTVQIFNYSGISQATGPYTFTNPSLRCSGHVWLDGSTLYLSSDRRIKENITDVDLLDAKRFVENVVPKKYNLKTRKDKQEYGYIAQDLLRHRFGELVDIQKDETMKASDDIFDIEGVRLSVDYQKVCTLLHTFVNDLSDRVSNLVKRVSELERNKHGHQNDHDH